MPKVVIHHSENSGVGYYRMWMHAKYLERLGWEVVTFPDELPHLHIDKADAKPGELSWEEICQGADLLVTQRSDNPSLVALLMAIRDQYNIPLVFEIDDDLYDISEDSPAILHWYEGSPLREMAELVMQNVDAITTSTPVLADVYRQHNPNVYVLPNCQDPEDWKRAKKPKKNPDEIVVGWAGSSTHYEDLEILKRPLKKLVRNYPNVRAVLIGCAVGFFDNNPKIDVRIDWAPVRDWQKKLASLGFDIGLCPVTDRPFNRGKSNIKWQEYSMLGIPTIASNIGSYKEIEPGVTGLLAENDEHSWYYQMEKLVKDEQLRRQIGKQAKRNVLENYNIEVNIKHWDRAYRQIIHDFKRKTRLQPSTTP